MPEYATVETDDGAVIGSNSESQGEIQEILGVKVDPKAKETPEKEAKAESDEEKAHVDSTGREHDEKGRFKAKPIPDKPKEAKPGEKPDEAKPGEKPDEKSEDEAKKDKSRPGRLDARRRVEEATRLAAEERRRADAIERENRALREAAQLKKEAPKQAATPDGEDPEPDLTDDMDPREYVKKLTEWQARRLLRERDQQHQQQSQQQQRQKFVESRVSKFSEAMEKRLETEPDFQERIDPRLASLTPTFLMTPKDGHPTVWNALASEIMESDSPADLLIYLSENEKELQRLATLRPRELTKAIAKMEAKLEAATTGPPAPEIPPFKPSAARPVTPVTGAATTATGPPDVDDDDYVAYRLRQIAKER